MERSEITRETIKESIHNGELSNDDLLNIFEYIRDVLNLQTIETFRQKYGLSYNGVKYKKNKRTYIQGKQYIVDNN